VPQLLPTEMLQAGNSFVQGTAQLSLFLGPVLAGGLIAVLGQAATAQNALGTQGIGIAFGIDTLSFVASLVCLSLMRLPALARKAGPPQNVMAAIQEGLAYVWGQTTLRVMFVLLVAMNFLVLGPVVVGIPVLAQTRLAEGAAAYGIIMSVFGGGALLGILLSSLLPPIKPEHFGTLLLVIISWMGIGVALMPLFASTAVIAVIMLSIGVTNGFVNIHFFTWLQKRIPRELMGRVMSLLMFSSIGLAPVSYALAGVILQISLNGLFIGGGLLMAAVSLAAIVLPAVRQMGVEPPVATPAA
jgi:hypothetical protein